MDNLIVAAVLALSIVVVLFKTGHIRKIIPYQAWLDVLVTIGLFAVCASQGAVTALIIATIGGFVFSLIMSLLYRIMPHERLARVVDQHGKTHWRWITSHPNSGRPRP